MRTEMILQEVETTYEKVKSLAGWSVDKNVVLTITSYYVTAGREFDAFTFNRAMDELKSRTGWFSPLRGNLLPMMAAFLSHFDSTEKAAERLLEKQKVLRNQGFKNTIHSYLAALLMSDDPADDETDARRAKALFDAMKKQHFLLTSDDDYAYAMLLGRKAENPVEHAQSMRTYYDALRKIGFRSGNELQWLSQVMTYMNIEFSPGQVERAEEIINLLKGRTKVKPVHYPMIGFLTVFQLDDEGIMQIINLAKQLEQSKLFRWNREMALSIAIGYVMHQLTESADQVSVSLATSVEIILRAQQAVMAVTVGAVAASSAASSSQS
ncbi:DUF4003 family protein [Sporosarcina sp. Te-1]|uniref:DUF4003 family protein n=1 Tax=Sporosarcina sp. Te-1 TaxID=2818390 RepID=UPI001A9CE914|nr:DUF4003 family protein [Sporosarcina sp. Te-1]QTD40008.1 DUF4003 family protein [Sporosarcina sp. Te-1]